MPGAVGALRVDLSAEVGTGDADFARRVHSRVGDRATDLGPEDRDDVGYAVLSDVDAVGGVAIGDVRAHERLVEDIPGTERPQEVFRRVVFGERFFTDREGMSGARLVDVDAAGRRKIEGGVERSAYVLISP